MPNLRFVSHDLLERAVDQWTQGNTSELYDLLYNTEVKGFADGCNYMRNGLSEFFDTKLQILDML